MPIDTDLTALPAEMPSGGTYGLAYNPTAVEVYAWHVDAPPWPGDVLTDAHMHLCNLTGREAAASLQTWIEDNLTQAYLDAQHLLPRAERVCGNLKPACHVKVTLYSWIGGYKEDDLPAILHFASYTDAWDYEFNSALSTCNQCVVGGPQDLMDWCTAWVALHSGNQDSAVQRAIVALQAMPL